MNFYEEYMDEDFIDYEMNLYKIKVNDFTFMVNLSDRIEYGMVEKVKKFLVDECIYYIRNKYPRYKGNYVTIHINRVYNGKFHNFIKHEPLL